MVLASGIAWTTASINVFMKDASQIVGIFIQFGFWLTPIIWPVTFIPERYIFLLNLIQSIILLKDIGSRSYSKHLFGRFLYGKQLIFGE